MAVRIRSAYEVHMIGVEDTMLVRHSMLQRPECKGVDAVKYTGMAWRLGHGSWCCSEG
jgi:hypothetical protein